MDYILHRGFCYYCQLFLCDFVTGGSLSELSFWKEQCFSQHSAAVLEQCQRNIYWFIFTLASHAKGEKSKTELTANVEDKISNRTRGSSWRLSSLRCPSGVHRIVSYPSYRQTRNVKTKRHGNCEQKLTWWKQKTGKHACDVWMANKWTAILSRRLTECWTPVSTKKCWQKLPCWRQKTDKHACGVWMANERTFTLRCPCVAGRMLNRSFWLTMKAKAVSLAGAATSIINFLSRQTRFCRDKHCSCRNKTFVVKKKILVAVPANDKTKQCW